MFSQDTVLEKITSHKSDDTIKYIHRNLLRHPVFSCFNKYDNIVRDQFLFWCDCFDTTIRMISENKHYICNYLKLMWTMIIIFNISYLFCCVIFFSIFPIVSILFLTRLWCCVNCFIEFLYIADWRLFKLIFLS